MIWETVRLALRSVRRNVLRSFLTLLGIVIGVAAVIAMITIGSGTTEKVKTDISKLGSNLLVVRAARPDRSGSTSFTARQLDDKDVAGLAKGLDDAKAVSAAAQKTVRVVYGAENVAADVTGTDTEYFTARDWGVAEGRLFTESEVRSGTNVCVIGETVRQQFFGAGDPDGQSIRVNRMSCKVIGVLQTKGFSGFGQDQDNTVIMPLAAYQRRIAGDRDIDTIYVAARDGVATARVQENIETIMRETRRIAPDGEDNFSVRDMTQIADAMASATTTMTGMLGAVAGVSLLVGGIGIMNIMLVSVTERTREIGIRLAIGAHEKHILIQFLVEATVLSLFGGLIGIAFGLGLAAAASYSLSIPFAPSLAVVLLAVGFSALIGMVFGFFPALRGARLDPIDALRHE
ncbi:putative ABC transport system permease protein [Mesorhizobium albiziae]|uniref:Putative ABC transport system permease protein n=1 Tax=Neomesorhizobium albiziae TaxID=335020 RepID=A0A1I3VC68_9HYPH|nr:ABC transporter permease [Mesorhizobium albiziae]GLS28740.1 multidrug ABC transporter substrate-binding protein [Mesorhizobium albiziae]SFJ91731.1 putative ABC transport system permease protein [Mesorhizobium albiziae]